MDHDGIALDCSFIGALFFILFSFLMEVMLYMLLLLLIFPLLGGEVIAGNGVNNSLFGSSIGLMSAAD